MEERIFFILFSATAVYVIFGNILYFAKILPALNESPKMLPSGQLNDVDRYLELLEERDEDYWFVPFLRNVRMVSLVLFFGYLVFVVLLVTR